MIGFGFMDNTVMIHAGNAIDLSLGVTFGLSTLSSAACGQICSDVAGVSFGGVIDAAAARLGLPSPSFTNAQHGLALVKRVGLLGNVLGVVLGCSLGLLNLLLIDTDQARELKLAAADGDAADFAVIVSNEEREDATVVTIEGPATKGLISSVTGTIAAADLAIIEIHAAGAEFGAFKRRTMVVTSEGRQVEDDGLEQLAQRVQAACKSPDRVRSFMLVNEALRKENEELRQQLQRTQERLDSHLVKVLRRGSVPGRPDEGRAEVEAADEQRRPGGGGQARAGA